jgi:hypothetical protein
MLSRTEREQEPKRGGPNDQQVIHTFYSHLSRLFVSSYATFFTLYLGYLVFFYAVLLPANFKGMTAAIILALINVAILALAGIFYLRARAFSKAMQYIEANYLKLSSGINVHDWFLSLLYPKATWLDKVAHFLFERPTKKFAPSELIVLGVLLISLISSLIWIVLFILPEPVGRT